MTLAHFYAFWFGGLLVNVTWILHDFEVHGQKLATAVGPRFLFWLTVLCVFWPLSLGWHLISMIWPRRGKGTRS